MNATSYAVASPDLTRIPIYGLESMRASAFDRLHTAIEKWQTAVESGESSDTSHLIASISNAECRIDRINAELARRPKGATK